MSLIASFNVNSVRARLPSMLQWLDRQAPDIVLLQEIKCVEEDFPADEFIKRGYHLWIKGQKSYNGVAILSKLPGELVLDQLPFNEEGVGIDGGLDEQARYIEVKIGTCYFASIYLPNGNPLMDDDNFSAKFIYKLRWMQRLNRYMAQRLQQTASQGEKIILGGDFNICREKRDMYQWQNFLTDATFHENGRQLFHQLLAMGMVDSWRSLHPDEIGYSYWDLRQGRWAKDEGMRIDYFLLSPEAADDLQDCRIDKQMRGTEKPSDHAPVMLEMAL